MNDVTRTSKDLAKYLAHLAACTRGSLKGAESRTMRITLKDSEAIQTAADLLSATHEPPADEHPDKARLDWLNDQPVHFIELDDFSIIDAKGLDVRTAIDAKRSAPTKGESR